MTVHHSGLDFAITPERVIRTHANVVLLDGNRAYKLKKPVKFPFLDYSTLKLRRKFIQAEYDLNRRFSPEIYLGVCTVVRRHDKLEFGELQQRLPAASRGLADYAVVMRRIPDDAWLPERMRAGLSDDDLHGLMRLLAATWRAHPANREVRLAGMPNQLRHNTVANIAECERLVPQCMARSAWMRLDALLRGWFEQNHPVFKDRVRGDHIRDGHGDLKPTNIAFIRGKPVVTDCIEFNPQFRRLDTLAEAAFLATGLEQLGAFDHAAEVFRAYRRAMRDDYPEMLRRYYQAHLACVMGKVTALQLEDPEIGTKQHRDALALARRSFALADFHAREPHVLVVAGVMGCGKSTVAAALSEHFGWPVVSSDVVRKRQMGVKPTRRLPQAAYSHDISARVYRALYDAANTAGAGVILDAQFSTRAPRHAAKRAATEAGGTAMMILCDAPDAVVRRRMRARERDRSRVSDATASMLRRARAEFEPVTNKEGLQLIRFDTRQPPQDVLALVETKLIAP
jgi:hypothetical protein